MTSGPGSPFPLSGRPLAAVRTISALLEAQGATWALAGALAANVYRHDVRATGDVDLLVGFGAFDSASALAALADTLERTGWALSDRRNRDWMLRARHPEYGLVDVLSVGMVYQERAVERAVVHVSHDGTELRVLAIEDVLIHKLIADRSKDAADVESILATDPEMDLEYLNHWLAEWDIEDRYEQTKTVVRERQALACERNR